jgi:hypothetical protein
MRTMIALVFAATIGFTLTTAAAAGAPGHVPKTHQSKQWGCALGGRARARRRAWSQVGLPGSE